MTFVMLNVDIYKVTSKYLISYLKNTEVIAGVTQILRINTLHF